MNMRDDALLNAVRRDARTIAAAAMIAAGFVAAAVPAAAQTFPARAIRIIVPLPPGATADTVPRLIGEKLTAKWNVPVVIENRPGAAQNLGAEIVAKSEPDGHTLLATPQGPLVISQSLFSKLNFDPAAFTPVTVMASLPFVLVASTRAPVSSLAELAAYAKANPNRLSYATPGVGSGTHLTMEWLQQLMGASLTHVPYQGAAPALTDVLAGHVDVMFDNAGNVVELIKAGKIRALAVTSRQRMKELPEIPAIAETWPSYVATSWFGVVAPPKTPPAIAAILSRAMVEALRAPDVAKKVADLSANVVANTPEEMAAFLKEEIAQWRHVIEAAKVKLD